MVGESSCQCIVIAMTDDDDLRVNTLHRFAKHSPTLILHEYSSCEVPAGCGGVVMRWIAPDQDAPSRSVRFTARRSARSGSTANSS